MRRNASKIYFKRATPLAIASGKRERRQAPSGPWLVPWGEAQSPRRPAAPSRLRARAESSPAIGRNERGGIVLMAFKESHWASL